MSQVDRLLESVIVIEEFCKELAAIAYAKYVVEAGKTANAWCVLRDFMSSVYLFHSCAIWFFFFNFYFTFMQLWYILQHLMSSVHLFHRII